MVAISNYYTVAMEIVELPILNMDMPYKELVAIPISVDLCVVSMGYLIVFINTCNYSNPQVQDFFIHFWQGMPTHMLPILGCQATINLITVCDCILYRVSKL